MEKKFLQIKDVVALSGLDRETLRFYENKGLLPLAKRTTAGYRLFPEETLKRIEFIKLAKESGFSLKEISEILKLGTKKNLKKSELNQVAKNKIDEIAVKINSLKEMQNILSLFVSCKLENPKCEMNVVLNEFKSLRPS